MIHTTFGPSNWWNNLKSELDQIVRSPSADPYDTGKATITTRPDKDQLIISIVKDKMPQGLITFSAFGTMDHVKTNLGMITFACLNLLKDEKSGSEDVPLNGLVDTAETVNKVFIQEFYSLYNTQLYGVGTALLQAAIEYGYSQGCEGRILLLASPTSHGFYFKKGLRTLDPEFDQHIGKDLNGPRVVREVCYMHMPEEGRAMWKDKIKQTPIFTETAKYLGEQP